jgi:type IV pilus assembly protein PilW
MDKPGESAMPELIVQRSRNSGFSLVEIMVGIAIGLLGVLVMMQVSVIFEGQKRTTTTGSDALTNGMTTLFTVERDVRRAGYGLSIAGALGCPILGSYNGAPKTINLTPVTITDGANGSPDTIRILASSKGAWSVPNLITTSHPSNATNIFLNTTLGIEVGDMMVLYEAGAPNCTLIQATGIPSGNVQVHHQNSHSNWNPPIGNDIYPPAGFSVGAAAINLGSLIDHTYSLDGNSNLLLIDYSTATNSNVNQIIASDIVNLQAQYGFDTRIGIQTDARVDHWSSAMFNADRNLTTGDNGDLARIYAVRIAVVARSALKEKPNPATNTCDVTIDTATTDPVRAANNPTWMAGNSSTGALETIAIDVSKNPDGTANPDWKCYRYKVFESVIPLRNLLWRES